MSRRSNRCQRHHRRSIGLGASLFFFLRFLGVGHLLPFVTGSNRRSFKGPLRTAKAKMIARALCKMPPEVDDVGVHGTQLLRQVVTQASLLEDHQVFPLIYANDLGRLAPAEVPDVLPEHA